MGNEEEIIIGFLFKRSGKDRLKESEIYLSLSIELGWFSTVDAKNFVSYAKQQAFLIEKDGLLSPGFDMETIKIPIGFYPTNTSFLIEKTETTEEDEQNIVNLIITHIAEQTKKDPDDIIQEIKQIEEEKNILTEVAVLFVAKKYDATIDNWFENVENTLFKR